MGFATLLICTAILLILGICYGWVAAALAALAMGLTTVWVLDSWAQQMTRDKQRAKR